MERVDSGMRVAVITTEFLRDFVEETLKQLRLDCKTEVFIYRDFSHVGELYLELEDQFDGFMVSGPVPKTAIIKRAHALNKPVMDFGTDLQSYYETFLQLIYQYGSDLDRGYFDMMDWNPDSKGMAYYLSTGAFGQFYTDMLERVSEMSLSEIAANEKKVLQKHISLWNEGKIDFSTTRFSSIVPQLKQAGVRFYFIYPHIDFIKSAFDMLIQEINLRRMKVNQTSVICVTLKENREAPQSHQVRERELNRLGSLLTAFNKENMGDFKLQANERGYMIFTSFKTIRKVTDSFRSCKLKPYLAQKGDWGSGTVVCVGYGIGTSLNHAMENASNANTEASVNSTNASFVVTERDEIVGPLGQSEILTVSSKVTPYILEVSKRVKLSTLTIQKILSAMAALGTNEITPQSLAATLNITVRSANRFLSNLVRYGEARVTYEKQNSSRGRPEKVYEIYLQNQ